MNLVQALRLSDRTRLALVGAGGKSTALFKMAREMATPVLVACTTHLAVEQLTLADRHFILEGAEDVNTIRDQLGEGVTLFTGPFLEDQCVGGLESGTMEKVYALADDLGAPLLVEADGSRGRPVKAPADHEPAIPAMVNTVVTVAGLSALGQPLDERWVQRPKIFSSLTGLPMGQTIGPKDLVRVVVDPQGGLKNIPQSARRVALLNQADTPELAELAKSMVSDLLSAYHAVVIATLAGVNTFDEKERPSRDIKQSHRIWAVHEPVAGIVLAAGGSRRFGQPKQLLPWKGAPMVRHVVEIAIQGGLSPVIVVTGAYRQEVESAVRDLPVKMVDNPDWESGQSSSVRAGLRALTPDVGAVVFILSDQPHVTPKLISELVAAHAASLSPIVAPQVKGRRANPVLFDRVTFRDLESLSGDVGGRALFTKFPVEFIPWTDASILLDVDTPEDYRRLLEDGENVDLIG